MFLKIACQSADSSAAEDGCNPSRRRKPRPDREKISRFNKRCGCNEFVRLSLQSKDVSEYERNAALGRGLAPQGSDGNFFSRFQ